MGSGVGVRGAGGGGEGYKIFRNFSSNSTGGVFYSISLIITYREKDIHHEEEGYFQVYTSPASPSLLHHTIDSQLLKASLSLISYISRRYPF
jgi:hypothetical protein